MNWSEEIFNTAWWLVKIFTISFFASFIAFLGCIKYTEWGAQFWSITGPFFKSKIKWKIFFYIVILFALALLQVRMNILFSFWSKELYDGLQDLDPEIFWSSMVTFIVIATLHIFRSLIYAYLREAFSIHWRDWLNAHLLSTWISTRTYFLGRFTSSGIDNPDQRIQQDIEALASNTISLTLGIIISAVSIFEFTIILWDLSTSMPVFNWHIPHAMVLIVYIYVFVTTIVAFKIGRPLVALNFQTEKLNANYRYALMRLREHGESIAFYQGELREKSVLYNRFSAVINNSWQSLRQTLKLTGYNLGVSQVAVVFPLFIQVPRLLSGEIKLGTVTQTANAFGELQDALSFFRTSYDDFAKYRAVLNRLTGLQTNIRESHSLKLPNISENAMSLAVRHLSVSRPDGSILIRELNLGLNPGQALLIKGPSGAGKTTLLRTMAGLWPFSTGTVERPASEVCLFLSQSPYIPLGTLRSALAYPSESVRNEIALAALDRVHLGHLSDQIDVEQNWSQVLSPGEQQRLAFGRALVNRPAIVFLDEATSATDPGLEHSLYALLRAELPHAMLVSVGHRDSLVPFHDTLLSLDREGGWQIHQPN